MKQIELTQGLIALCDDDDYERLARLNWYAARSFEDYIYAETSLSDNRNVSMHRYIFGLPEGVEVYHLNGNFLDNRRENLRVGSRQERITAHGLRRDNKTGYKGVSFVQSGKWRAIVGSSYNKTRKHLGYFADPLEAAKAYNQAALELYGEHALLNDLSETRAHVKDREPLQVQPPTKARRKPTRNTSGFVGVDFSKQKNKWRARINKDRKQYHIGFFATPEEAAGAYNARAIELYGENATLNEVTKR